MRHPIFTICTGHHTIKVIVHPNPARGIDNEGGEQLREQ